MRKEMRLTERRTRRTSEMWAYKDKECKDKEACKDWILTTETCSVIQHEIILPYLREVYENGLESLLEDVSNMYYKDWTLSNALDSVLWYLEDGFERGMKAELGYLRCYQNNGGDKSAVFYYKGQKIGAVKDVVELFMTEEYREQREKFLKVGLGTINSYELMDLIAKGEFSTEPEDMLRYFLSVLSDGLEEGEIEDDYYIGYDSLKVYLE